MPRSQYTFPEYFPQSSKKTPPFNDNLKIGLKKTLKVVLKKVEGGTSAEG